MGDDLTFVATVLVGVFSGIAGSIIGPLLLRTLNRNDRALEERRTWVREKMKWVFGSDEKYASDGPVPDFTYLVPPTGFRVHRYNMHVINPSLEESLELRLLQPRRSLLARNWLERWMWDLQHEQQILFEWHQERPHLYPPEKARDRAEDNYQRRVRAVQSSMAQWAIGNRPSAVLWFSLLPPVKSLRAWRLAALRKLKKAEVGGASLAR